MPESSHPEYTVEVLEKVLRLVAYAGSGESSIILRISFTLSSGLVAFWPTSIESLDAACP